MVASTAGSVAASLAGCGPEDPAGRGGRGGHGGHGGLAGAGGGPEAPSPDPDDRLVFEPVDLALTDADKRQVRAAPRAWVDGVEVPLGYHPIARTGDRIGGGTFGRLVDHTGAPLLADDGSELLSDHPDHTSLHAIGAERWAVTHFETTPGAMYLTELAQDPITGDLTAISTAPIDFSGVHGLWTPCAGSTTPWGTHLGGEEFPPEARTWDEAATLRDIPANQLDLLAYLGIEADPDGDGLTDLSLAEADAALNPYWYGWPVEVEVRAGGGTTVAKHYAMGRVAVEVAKVMPDQRTVYVTDDGTNRVLLLFVADVPGDLSAGELYAMRWHQTGDDGAGAADLEWVPLGHATDAGIEALFARDLRFADLFESADPIVGPALGDDRCPRSFVGVNTGAGPECLKLRPGMALPASRLETARYAAYVGATTELHKAEGLAHDPATDTLFLAVSAIERGMERFARLGAPSEQFDGLGPDHIGLAPNDCGAVYALDLAPDPEVGSDHVAKGLRAVLEGAPYDGPSPIPGNSCDVSSIANPDNLTFVDGYDTLIVGEDTRGGHQNDAVWALDLGTGRLDRILSAPYGSETTSPYWYPDLGGHGILVAVVQHPFGDADQDELEDPAEARAWVGYVGPFPRMFDAP